MLNLRMNRVAGQSGQSPPRGDSISPRGDDRLLEVVDLFLSGDQVADHLVDQLSRLVDPTGAAVAGERLLDCYLLAAGLSQIWDDWLESDLITWSKVAGVAGNWGPAGRAAAGIAKGVGLAGAAARSCWHGTRRNGRLQLEQLREALADALVGGPTAGAPIVALAAQARQVVSALPAAVRTGILRPPTCFASMDLRPADVFELALRFLDSGAAEPGAHLTVVGVRTSGSYMAPLVAALLRSSGHPETQSVTVRPGVAGAHRSLARLPRLAEGVIVVDDPPATGEAVAGAVAAVLAAGVSAEDVTILLPLVAGQPVPARLAGYRAVTLDFAEWDVLRWIPPGTVDAPVAGRGHWHGYRQNGGLRSGVEAVGTGYMGRQVRVMADLLAGAVPSVVALPGSLIETEPLDPPGEIGDDALAAAIASYVQRRRTALATSRDTSIRLRGRGAAWQECGNLLGTFLAGRAAPLIRPLSMAVSRRLVEATEPGVVDGAMALSRWRTVPSGRIVKTAFSGTSFSGADLASHDPLLDLASAAVEATAGGRQALAEQLPERYQRSGDGSFDAERWMLYRFLLHHRSRAGAPLDRRCAHESAMARCVQEYIGQWALRDVKAQPFGQICAIDIDGVLESERIGIPSTSPTGALALRALAVHGYRPVLVSGRSLPDVVERCRSYRLSGGVAEYGALVHRPGRPPETVIQPQPRREVDRLRDSILRRDGLWLHPDWKWSLRVSDVTTGSRRPLSPDQVSSITANLGLEGRFVPVPGVRQTDLVHVEVSKGTGLERLTGPDAFRGNLPQVALAVGDSPSDRPMLELARLAVCPANASPELDSCARRTRGSHQRGLAQAVQMLIGHAPGRCKLCRRPPASPRSSLLLDVLDARAGGMGVRALRSAAVAVRCASQALQP